MIAVFILGSILVNLFVAISLIICIHLLIRSGGGKLT